MNVILIGYRGSGKTTVGRRLAERTGRTFVDVDNETCRRFGIDSIAEIWRVHGEPAWREQEVAVTQALCGREDHVIGLGGGTLMQPGAHNAVQAAADTLRVYLACDRAELFRRIQSDTRTAAARPNLTKLGGGEDEIRHMLNQREPVYQAVADVCLDVTHRDPEQTTRWLIQRLSDLDRAPRPETATQDEPTG